MTFLESYRKLLKETTWLPDIWIELSGLSVLSAVVRRKIYTEISVRRFFPNLYVMLLAPPRSGKGVAIHDTAERILREVDSELVLPNRFTGEGIFYELSEKGAGIVFSDEFTDIVGTGKKYMSGITTVLTTLYNAEREEINTKLAKKRYRLVKPYFCMLVGSQPENIAFALRKEHVLSGLLPRFIIHMITEKPKRRKVKTWSEARELIREVMNELIWLDIIFRIWDSETLIKLSPEAEKIYFNFLDEVWAYQEDMSVNAYLSAVGEHVLKLAILYYIDRKLSLMSILYNNKILSFLSIYNIGMKEVREGGVSKIDVFNIIDKNDKMTKIIEALKNEVCGETIPPDIMTFVIDKIKGCLPSALSAVRMIWGTFDEKMYERLKLSIMRAIPSKCVKINDRYFLPKREIERVMGMTYNKLAPYVKQLIEDGILGEIVSIPVGKGRPRPLFPVLIEIKEEDTDGDSEV